MIDKSITVFGIRPVIEAVNAGKTIDKIMIQQGLTGELFAELKKLIQQHQIPFQYVPYQKLQQISSKNHQGIIAFISQLEYEDIEAIVPQLFEAGQMPFILILDKITDVRNFGAICRTAECAGVHALVIPSRGGAQINADAIKTSAGALHKIPVCREHNLKNTINFLKESGLAIVGCTEKTDDLIFEGDFKRPLAVIMGSEETGISPEYLKMCDQKLKIPMHGSIQSLNVSVAAGVIIYEALRQRGL